MLQSTGLGPLQPRNEGWQSPYPRARLLVLLIRLLLILSHHDDKIQVMRRRGSLTSRPQPGPRVNNSSPAMAHHGPTCLLSFWISLETKCWNVCNHVYWGDIKCLKKDKNTARSRFRCSRDQVALQLLPLLLLAGSTPIAQAHCVTGNWATTLQRQTERGVGSSGGHIHIVQSHWVIRVYNQNDARFIGHYCHMSTSKM